MQSEDARAFGQLISSLATELVAFYALALPSESASLEVTRRAAHSLKGACLSMGAQALGERFAEIERHAKDAKFSEISALSASSRDLGANSIHALRTFAARAGK